MQASVAIAAYCDTSFRLAFRLSLPPRRPTLPGSQKKQLAEQHPARGREWPPRKRRPAEVHDEGLDVAQQRDRDGRRQHHPAEVAVEVVAALPQRVPAQKVHLGVPGALY